MNSNLMYRMQPHSFYDEEDDDFKITYRQEGQICVRSVGNSVGTKPFSNTNRKKPRYTKRLNRKARAHGFPSHAAFVGHMTALLNLEVVKEGE